MFTRLRASRRAARFDALLHGAVSAVLCAAFLLFLPAWGAIAPLAAIALAFASWQWRRRQVSACGHLRIDSDGAWLFAPQGELATPRRLVARRISQSIFGSIRIDTEPGTSPRRVVLWADSMPPDAWRHVQISVARAAQLQAEPA